MVMLLFVVGYYGASMVCYDLLSLVSALVGVCLMVVFVTGSVGCASVLVSTGVLVALWCSACCLLWLVVSSVVCLVWFLMLDLFGLVAGLQRFVLGCCCLLVLGLLFRMLVLWFAVPIGCGWLFVCLVGFVLIALDVIYGCWYGVLGGWFSVGGCSLLAGVGLAAAGCLVEWFGVSWCGFCC